VKRTIRTRTLLLGAGLAILLIGMAVTAVGALDYMDVVDTYWRVHDEVLQPTEMGRYYIDLFWRTNPELCELIVSHDAMKDDGLVIILQFEPGLRALVDGEGDEVIITPEMVERVEAYLDLLIEIGSPELGAAIQAERARAPLSELTGMTFEQARIALVGLPEETLATPTSTNMP
jgi:hypothetical protein